jgi:hypothetical protein
MHSAGLGGDVPVGVFNSPNTKVYNNTILVNGDYPNAIEYRFVNTTGVSIQNNLTDAAITARDGATGAVANNLLTAQASWFVNAAIGDLHVKSTATQAIDQVAVLADALLDYDSQCHRRVPREITARMNMCSDRDAVAGRSTSRSFNHIAAFANDEVMPLRAFRISR